MQVLRPMSTHHLMRMVTGCWLICLLFLISGQARIALSQEVTWIEPAPEHAWPDSVPWWLRNNLRTMQTNLPAYEATLEVDSLIFDLDRFSVNTLIINAGGIMAFYPTKLPFHYVNPYMQPQMLGDVIAKCHARNIRVIVRFDFSRMHRSIFEANPDWCYISPDGERIINDDMYMASINAPYVQEKALEIIEEVMQMYPIDGIFINMPGYHTRNHYEGTYHGIDQNEHDRKRFHSWSGGMELPATEDQNDPAFRKYQEFKSFTAKDWIKKVHQVVKSNNPHVAVCTYMDDHVDIIRHESLTRGLPRWPYLSSDNVNSTIHSHPDKIVSNASIQQISFQSRYNAIEPEETAIRLYQNLANGSGLDMSLMGDFRDYEDERNFAIWEAMYAHHKTYEPYFGRYESPAEICLISPGYWPGGVAAEEYRGIQRMLKEAHLQFDIIEAEELVEQANRLQRYDLFILPRIRDLDDSTINLFRQLCLSGKLVIATSQTLRDNPAALEDLFGAQIRKFEEDGSGYYLHTDQSSVLGHLSGQSLLFWKYFLGFYDFAKADTSFLEIYTPGRPGPPEKIGGHEPTGYHAIGLKSQGNGLAVLLPLDLGRIYYLEGFEQHKNILLDLIDLALPEVTDLLQTDAHEQVEVILQKYATNIPSNLGKPRDEGMLLHLINLTGFGINTYFSPVPVHNIHLRIRTGFEPSAVLSMIKDKKIEFAFHDGYVFLTIDQLGQFDGILLKR